MKRFIFYFLLLGSPGLLFYGCGSSGSSSVETVDNGQMASSVMDGVTLINSKQGQAGGFADIDGDTIPDKVVGAPYATASANTGVVLAYKGDGSGGYSSEPTTLLSGDDNTGFSFVRLEKGTTDAVEQFAVGAINGNGEDVSLSGSVSIYKGASNGPQLVAKLSGEGPMDKFGSSIASGDLNGDGYSDIIIGAPFNTPDPSLFQKGSVYIYFGPGFSASNRIALQSSKTYSGLGWAVSAGDVGSDGTADLLISTGYKVLVYYGGTSFDINNPTVNIDSPSVIVKSSSDTYKTLTVIGDLDGDGFGEIAAGAATATANSYSNAGTVVIVNGATAGSYDVGTASSPSTPSALIVRVSGADLFDRFGSSIASVADMDGDGKQELVVGATAASNNPNYLSGKVYLFKSGGRSGSSWSAASVFNGDVKDQSYGYFLAAAPTTGTLKNHLLIGAPRSNMDTGGVSMIDMETGETVTGGSSGGGSGGELDCTSMPGMCM